MSKDFVGSNPTLPILDANSKVHKKMRVVLEGALLKLIYKHLVIHLSFYLGADVTQLARVIGRRWYHEVDTRSNYILFLAIMNERV